MSQKPVVRSPWLRWGLLALVQLALIGVPLADRLEVQMTGTAVTLDLVPIDPRDLLRGDYVIINLAAATIAKDLVADDTAIEQGDTVFVGLTVGADGIAQPARLTATRAAAGGLALAGTVSAVRDDNLTVDYGMDAFFLPEGTGTEIERMEAERIKLVAAVAPDGRALPLTLLIDGTPFKSEAAF